MAIVTPLSDEIATKVVRIIYSHLGGANYRDSTKESKRLKWLLLRPLPQSARDEINALGVELLKGASQPSMPPSIYIHVNKAFNVKEAVKGIEKPGKGIRVRTIRDTDKMDILKKLLPYVTADDVNLSTYDLAIAVHDRVIQDL